LDVNEDIVIGVKYMIENYGIELSTLQYKSFDSFPFYNDNKSQQINYKINTNNVNVELFYNKEIDDIPILDNTLGHLGIKWKNTIRKYSDSLNFLESSNEKRFESNSVSLVLGFHTQINIYNYFSVFCDLNGLLGYAMGNTLQPPDTNYESTKSLELELTKKAYLGFYSASGVEYIIPNTNFSIYLGYKGCHFEKNDFVNSVLISSTYSW